MASAGRSPDGVALIGPNAVLQTVWAMEREIGHTAARDVLEMAGIAALPSGDAMIAEAEALRLHHALAALHPREAAAVALAAAEGTADYIIANRIPRPAAWLLRHLPAPLAARALMKAIAKHAWTFIGAGAFTACSPWRFAIDRGAAGDATTPPPTLFLWYGAVFARLYSQLVRAGSGCTGAAPDPRHPQRWHYSIEALTAVARPAQAVPRAPAASPPAPGPASAMRRRPALPAPPTSQVAS